MFKFNINISIKTDDPNLDLTPFRSYFCYIFSKTPEVLFFLLNLKQYYYNIQMSPSEKTAIEYNDVL